VDSWWVRILSTIVLPVGRALTVQFAGLGTLLDGGLGAVGPTPYNLSFSMGNVMPRFVVVVLDEGPLARADWQDEPGAEGTFTVSEDQVLTILGRLFERETEVEATLAKVAAGMNRMFHLSGGNYNPVVSESYREAEGGLVRLDSLIHYNTE